MISLTPVLLTPGKCCRPKSELLLGGWFSQNGADVSIERCLVKRWNVGDIIWAVSIPKVNTGTPQQDISWACDTGKYFMANWWSSHSSLMPYERSLLSFPRSRNLQPRYWINSGTPGHPPPTAPASVGAKKRLNLSCSSSMYPKSVKRGFRWWQFMSSFPRRR